METLSTKSLEKPMFIHALFFICILGGASLRFLWGNDFVYNIFIDRDLLRGWYLSDEFQYLGSEIGGNVARTPGGVMSYFFHALQQINPSPEFLRTVVISLDCLVLFLIPKLFTRFIGKTSALFVAALYASAPVVLECLWKFWNPSVAPLLSVFIYWSLLVFMVENRQWALPFSFALIGVTSQFHVSFFILIPLFLIIIFVFNRRQLTVKTTLIAFCSFLITFLPYLLIEIPAGFQNFANVVSLDMASPEPEISPSILSILFKGSIVYALARLTGGRTFLQDNLPSILEDPIFNFGAYIVFNIGLILVAFYVAKLVYNFVRKIQGAKVDKILQVERASLLLAAAACCVGVFYSDDPAARYLIFVLLPGLFFVGTAYCHIDIFISRFYGNKALIFFSLCVIATLVTKISGTAYYYVTSERESASSFAVKEKIVKFLSSEFGYTIEDLEYKVSHLTLNTKGVPVGSSANFGMNENQAISYIAHTNGGIKTKTPRYSGCALVVMRDRRNKKLPILDQKTILSYLPDSANLRVERSINVDDEFLFLGYRLDHPNCLRTMGNAYFPTIEERFADELVTKIPSGSATIAESKEHRTRFGIILSEKPRINAMIEVVYDEGLIDVSFHANALRGYAPSFVTQRATASSLSVHFLDKQKAEPIIFSVPDPLGTTGFYTPWQFEQRFLPKGTYQIDLVIENFEPFIQFGPSQANPAVDKSVRRIKKIRVSEAFVAN